MTITDVTTQPTDAERFRHLLQVQRAAYLRDGAPSLAARRNPRTPSLQSITAADALLPPRPSLRASHEGKEPVGIFFDFSLSLCLTFVHVVATLLKPSRKIAHAVLSVSSRSRPIPQSSLQWSYLSSSALASCDSVP